MIYEIFDKNKIETAMGSSYNVIYINYEKKDGIEIKDSLSELKNDVENFYKMYVFNEARMFTCLNFGEEKKMVEVSLKGVEDVEKRSIYIKQDEITKVTGKDYKKINIHVGVVDEKQVFQYIGFEGGR